MMRVMNWVKHIFNRKSGHKALNSAQSSKIIFLDYASATPVLPEVVKEMEPYWTEHFHNPNAIYEEGVAVKKVVEDCRGRIAKILGVNPRSVIFTSGGTEANVLAVRGVKLGRVIVETECHPSVAEAVRKSDSKEVVLISSVTTDNDLGRQIRAERKEKGSDHPLLHVDASQTAAYYSVSPEALACDLLTLDSAKLYGPKGIGALIVRNGVTLDLPPLGTPSVPLIVGFTKALEMATFDKEAEFVRLQILSDMFLGEIEKDLPQAIVTTQAPNIVHVSVPNMLPEFLVLSLDKHGVNVSAGPACESSKPEPADSPVRFSFGKMTTEEEIKKASEIFCRTVQNLLKYNSEGK